MDLAAPPAVTIGSASALVEFAGLTGAGVDQINVTVPTGLVSTGVMDVPVTAVSGPATTQTGLLLTVQSGR